MLAMVKETWMSSFPGVDYLDFDSLLSDEEKFARNHNSPVRRRPDHADHRGIQSQGKFPVQLVPQMAELGLLWRKPERVRVRGNVQC
jgi:hypothetical protein